MDVKDKSVFITGAAMGIGRAVVELLLEKEAKVLFCDINEPRGEQTLEELLQNYPYADVTFVPCDVTDSHQFKETFSKAVSRFGAVDICINNAGILDETDWAKCIAVNQVAQTTGSMLALDHMRRDKGGRGGVIINTASVDSFFYEMWEFPVYASTKHAMMAFTTCWSSNPDNQAHGVRWGAVCPGACVTEIIRWEKEGQLWLKLEDQKKFRDSFDWMIPRDTARGYLTLLEDDESNGGIMKIFKKGGQLYQELWIVDKSNHPSTSLCLKYCKEQPAQ